MTEKEYREIGKLQAEIVVLGILRSKQPFAYTGGNIGEMTRDIQRNSRREDCFTRFQELTKNITKEEITEINEKFSDVKFSLEDQRILLKEIINKAITIEEFIEEYK